GPTQPLQAESVEDEPEPAVGEPPVEPVVPPASLPDLDSLVQRAVDQAMARRFQTAEPIPRKRAGGRTGGASYIRALIDPRDGRYVWAGVREGTSAEVFCSDHPDDHPSRVSPRDAFIRDRQREGLTC